MGRKPGSEQDAGPPGCERWLLLRFQPTSLFSLRMTHATNKGGRTLLVPTPYAFKLALLDAAFRAWPAEQALSRARGLFRAIAGATIRFLPPERAVIQHTFIKILQVKRDAPPGWYEPTVAFREYVQYEGRLTVAVDVLGLGEDGIADVVRAAKHIQYIGKRGSFFQYLGSELCEEALPLGFTTPESPEALLTGKYGTTQYLDDLSPELVGKEDAWERVSTYGRKSLRLGKDRILVRTLLPYRVKAEGYSFTAYERL